MANSNRVARRWMPLALGTLLALGAALVWAFLWMWPTTVLQYMLAKQSPSTYLMVTSDGQVLQSTTSLSMLDQTFRTLDGQLVEGEEPTQSSYVSGALYGPDMPEIQPAAWGQRIVSFGTRRLTAYWYLVAEPSTPGRSYLVGYDARTRHLIGHLSAQGFSTTVPAIDRQFQLPNRTTFYGDIATTTHWRDAAEPYSPPAGPVLLYLVSAGKLLKVNLDRQTIEPVNLPGSAISIGMIALPPPKDSAKRDDTPRALVVRLVDELLVIDDQGQTLRRIPIPAAARDLTVSLYLTPTDRVVLTASHWLNSAEGTTIYWLDGQPAQLAQERTWSSPTQPGTPASGLGNFLLGMSAPAPLLWGLTTLAILPNSKLSEGKANDYASAFADSLAETGSILLCVMAVSLVLAVLCARRQARLHGSQTWGWVALVLLLGPAGYLAYRLQRPWPLCVPCPRCRQRVPRKLANCTLCAVSFEPPAVLGVEIFA